MTTRLLSRALARGRATLAEPRLRIERQALSALKRPEPRDTGRILCYHSVGTPSWRVNDVAPAQFRRSIELALEHKYVFRNLEGMVEDGGRPNELALTFDDGLASVEQYAAPILKTYGIPFTVFVVTDWADGNSSTPDLFLDWRQIEGLMSAGAAIGSHSVTHANFSGLTPAEAHWELETSREIIGKRLGVAPRSFAIPVGRSKDWSADAGEMAVKVGYEMVFAACEDRRPNGTLGRTFITKFDNDARFLGALNGAFDNWEEWL